MGGTARAGGGASSTADDTVARSLLRHSLRSTVWAAGQALVLVVVVVVALRNAGADHARVNLWACALVVNLLVYSVTLHRVSRRLEEWAPLRGLTVALVVVQFIAGTCWGSLAFVVEGADASAAAAVMAAVLMIVTGNLIYSAATFGAFLAMHLPLIVLGVIGLVGAGYPWIAGMVAFTGMSGFPLRAEIHDSIVRAVRTAETNLRLAHEVREQQAELQRTNLGLLQANAELAHRATRDPLTHLANRFLLDAHLHEVTTRAEMSGRPPSLIYFDIDRFKAINDTFGHAAGDAVLTAVAKRVSAVLRESDLFARLGGDEFVVVMVDDSPESALETARRVHRAFADPFLVDGEPYRFTASIGVATASPPCTAKVLLARADGALYRAKENGRDQVQAWTGALGHAPAGASRDRIE